MVSNFFVGGGPKKLGSFYFGVSKINGVQFFGGRGPKNWESKHWGGYQKKLGVTFLFLGYKKMVSNFFVVGPKKWGSNFILGAGPPPSKKMGSNLLYFWVQKNWGQYIHFVVQKKWGPIFIFLAFQKN